MKTVVVASLNPVKLRATELGFTAIFPQEHFSFQSAQPKIVLPSQPVGDEATLDCATQRAEKVRVEFPLADYWVGIEGGVTNWKIGMGTFAWVVVVNNELTGRGRSGEFFLPEKVAELVRQGMELGEADDLIFSRNNSKQSNGAIGLLTDDAVDRTGLYVPAVIFALIPFKNPQLYSPSKH